VGSDIVIGNVKYRRISGEWMMTPRGTGGMFHIDPRRRELLDEIERLQADIAAERERYRHAQGELARQDLFDVEYINGLRTEIEQLRTEGDKLRRSHAVRDRVDEAMDAVFQATFQQLQADIERLRTAGDALVWALDDGYPGTWATDLMPSVKAWQEARREQ
jgi:hypothetical protein